MLTHPDQQVDSFGIYAKGCILLSKVKVFNTRYRSLKSSGDPTVSYRPEFRDMWEGACTPGGESVILQDPRRTAAFMALDHIANTFRSSFPTQFKNPIPNGIVDNHLYTASLMPHLSVRFSDSLDEL